MRKLNESIAHLALPDRMRYLKIEDRGFPVPWFVAYIDGKPDFRVVDTPKIEQAIRKDLCWLCGQTMGRFRTFTIGPMCVVNRISSEPPSHLDCAEYAVKACPFLTKPRMRRNDQGLEEMREQELTKKPAGIMIERNPGVTALWTLRGRQVNGMEFMERGYRVIRQLNGLLFRLIDEPHALAFWSQGRPATREEVEHSVNTGLVELERIAKEGGEIEIAMLTAMVSEARHLIAAHMAGFP